MDADLYGRAALVLAVVDDPDGRKVVVVKNRHGSRQVHEAAAPPREDRDALEVARAAQINFDNAVTALPLLRAHPFYAIARHQLDCAVARLEGKPDPDLQVPTKGHRT